jgi:hypothetical protein
MRRLALATLLVAGCAAPHGVAVDLTIRPNCVNDNHAVASLTVTVNATPAAQLTPSGNSFQLAGASFFADVGRSNRVVLILPDATRHVDVTVQAWDARAAPAGLGETGIAITGAGVYYDTLDLGNALCPVTPGPGVDGGGGDGPPVAGPVTFISAGDQLPMMFQDHLDLTPPPGAKSGDTLLAIIDYDDSGQPPILVTTPTGFSELDTQTCLTNRLYRARWYWHLVAPADPPSYRFSYPKSIPTSGALAAYRGANPGQPVAGNLAMSDSGPPPFALPRVSIPAGAALAVALFDHPFNAAKVPTWTAPSGMQTRLDSGSNAIFDAPVSGPMLYAPGPASTSDGGNCALVDLIVLAP